MKRAKKNSLSPVLFTLLFRELQAKADGTQTPIDLSDVSISTIYLQEKLHQPPITIQGQDELFSEGDSLLKRVEAECDQFPQGGARYSSGVKASLADYVSKVMTDFLKVEEVDKAGMAFTNNFRVNLKPRNREVFAYGLQLVDALIELSIQTGTIGRRDVATWGSIKQKYEAFQPTLSLREQENALARDNILIDGYIGLVGLKTTFRQAYIEHRRNHAIGKGWQTVTGTYRAIEVEQKK